MSMGVSLIECCGLNLTKKRLRYVLIEGKGKERERLGKKFGRVLGREGNVYRLCVMGVRIDELGIKGE